MCVRQFLANYGSTTTSFQQMSDNYRLEILQHGFIEHDFYRVVAIYVDDICVMIGVSVTNKVNRTFLDILQNAKNIPIGVQLFDKKNQITRTNVSIDTIEVSKINNKVVCEYLDTYQIHGQLYVRYSNFVKGTQTMKLTEYVLPGLEQLLNKYKDNYKC